jgi:hypothetical protein
MKLNNVYFTMRGNRFLAKDVSYEVRDGSASVSHYQYIESADGKLREVGCTDFVRSAIGRAITNGMGGKR